MQYSFPDLLFEIEDLPSHVSVPKLQDKELALWNMFLKVNLELQTHPKICLFAGLLWSNYAPLVNQQQKQTGKEIRTQIELFSAQKIAYQFFVYDDGMKAFAYKFLEEYKKEPEVFDDMCSKLETLYAAASKTKVFIYHPLYKQVDQEKDIQKMYKILEQMF